MRLIVQKIWYFLREADKHLDAEDVSATGSTRPPSNNSDERWDSVQQDARLHQLPPVADAVLG